MQQAEDTPTHDAAQATISSQSQAKKSDRLDANTVTHWRDERDPVERRRLANLSRVRQLRERLRDKVDAQDGIMTTASEMQQAEDTMDQTSQTTGVNFAKGWRNIFPAPEKR